MRSTYYKVSKQQSARMHARSRRGKLRDHRPKNHPGDLDDEPEENPIIMIAGDFTQKDDNTVGKINDTTSTDVHESVSCMEVHGDEEWLCNYEEMEEEDMGDRMIIDQEGDTTKRCCQRITIRPDWDTSHFTGMTRSMLSCERPDKIVETALAPIP